MDKEIKNKITRDNKQAVSRTTKVKVHNTVFGQALIYGAQNWILSNRYSNESHQCKPNAK